MKATDGTTDPHGSLISLSLKPRRNWSSHITAVISFCVAIFCTVVIVIQWTVYDVLESLYLEGLISEAPTEKYDWILIALVVVMVYWGILETTKATKSFWLTKDLNKDINTEGVVVLRPISKSDLK